MMDSTPRMMEVIKYIPERMYGFLRDPSGGEVFFHLRVFRTTAHWDRSSNCQACSVACQWADAPPPPILGEKVEVTMDTTSEKPRAQKVLRAMAPKPLLGKVDIFDVTRGYGFIHGSDAGVYHLHRCEVTDGRIPLPGQTVMFFPGSRQGKPRACHVKIC
jgi:cold shock CspA family protein